MLSLVINTETLYHKGLFFLKELAEEYGTDEDITQLVLDTFFNGTYTETQFRTLNFIQSDSYIDSCLKNITYVIERIYAKLGKDSFRIRVDTNNVREILLPPYINVQLNSDVKDADICFRELVIPLVYNNVEHSTYTLGVIKKIRQYISKGGITKDKFIVEVASLFEPVFSYPTEDTYSGFIYINPENIVDTSADVLGIFTNTEFFRIVNIGINLYIDFIKDGILYKQIIKINSDKDLMELYNVLNYAEALSHPTTLLVNYQKNRRDILACQEINQTN